MNANDPFSRIRRRFALEAKRVQFRARQSQFLFTLFHDNGALRYASRATIAIGLLFTISAIIYYSFSYSTRYKSELQFSIQNVGFFHSLGGASQPGSAPDLALIQNTQIAYEYLTSYDLFTAFLRERDFENAYASNNIDFFSRFSRNWNDERKFDYWQNLIEKKIQIPGGLIKLRMTAFEPTLANELNQFAVLKLSERLNSVNSNIFTLLTDTNHQQLEASQRLYSKAINDLSAGRQTFEQIDPLKWSDDITKIVTEINTTLLLSKSELATLNKQKLGLSPQAEIIERRLIELNTEIMNLKRSLTAIERGTASVSVAETARVISFLELKKSIAEKLVEISYENYAVSKQLAELTRNFIQVFVEPNIVLVTSYTDRLLIALIAVFFNISIGIMILYLLNFIRVRL